MTSPTTTPSLLSVCVCVWPGARKGATARREKKTTCQRVATGIFPFFSLPKSGKRGLFGCGTFVSQHSPLGWTRQRHSAPVARCGGQHETR